MAPALYIFDLDGTLVDSAGDICSAVAQVVSEFAAPVEEAAVRACIARGEPLADSFAELAPGLPGEPMILRYREIYSAGCTRTSVPFPGVVETLEQLGPERCAVATTKRSWLAKLLLDRLGLTRHFALVQGTDDFPHKPHPAILHRILERFGVPPERALMVGDTEADILCARAAGVPCAAVLYGIGSASRLASLQPDYIFAQLPDVLGV